MSVLLKNECGVQTILPMGLECVVVDATTPNSLDGTIYLNITGGSTPYSVTWNNGSNSQNLYSISAGTYTATVVDYYGDYTATTTCTVDTTQFYVDFFEDCGGEYNLYLTGLTDSYLEGSVYKMSANTGCWIYSGKTLNGSNSLSFDNITQGPYETCDECDPPIIPPYFPEMLCLFTETPYTTYQFEFYGFYNDRPTYTGTSTSSSGFTIEWTTGTTNQWKVVGKPGNSLTNLNDTYNPLGAWNLNGTTQTWTAVSGSCPTVPELTATHVVADPKCESSCVGSSIVITANGGVPPYTYSFDGGSSTGLPSAQNLCPGNHTYQVTDSVSNTFTSSFTINKGVKVTTYTLSLTYTTEDTGTVYGSQVGNRLKYYIKVTPELPLGTEITVPINVSVQTTSYRPGQTNVTYTPFFTSGGTSISPTTNSQTSVNIYKNYYFANNYPYDYTARTYNVLYDNVKLKKDLVVSGYVDTSITKVADEISSCCSPFTVYNPSSTIQYYNWTNCTGGTENSASVGIVDGFKVSPGQTVSLCACSVRKGNTSGATNGASLIITQNAGPKTCSPLTDGNIQVSAGFGAPSINGACNSLRVQTPGKSQLYSQLYLFTGGNQF